MVFGGIQGRKGNIDERDQSLVSPDTVSSQSSRSMERKVNMAALFFFLSIHLLSIYHAYSVQHILNLITIFSLTYELFRLLFQFPNTQPSRALSLPPPLLPFVFGSWAF